MKDSYRAVYLVAEDTAYGEWIRDCWEGHSPVEDPLHELYFPVNRLGEVRAWGSWPHWTVLDALTVTDPIAFAQMIRHLCCLTPVPVLHPDRLKIMANTSLVVGWSSSNFDALRMALARITDQFISRTPLADEEFQRAEWWIRRVGQNNKANLAALQEARDYYEHAGSPALPTSRHFRLGYLLRLFKEWQRAADDATGEARLQYFLEFGEPYWYAESGMCHLSIASGLNLSNEKESEKQLADFHKSLWPEFLRRCPCEVSPGYLAIMGEDPYRQVKVHFFDWLTEVFVEESRPALTILDRIPFHNVPMLAGKAK